MIDQTPELRREMLLGAITAKVMVAIDVAEYEGQYAAANRIAREIMRDYMKVESTEMQERAQQLWRELDGLDWSSHEQAIVGILRDALEMAYQDGKASQ